VLRRGNHNNAHFTHWSQQFWEELLNLAQFDGFVETMFTIGMAMTLFMGGMELNFGEIKGRPLFLAVGGWTLSLFVV
jgi:hypothetical protein